MKLLLKGAQQIVCVSFTKQLVKVGPDMKNLSVMNASPGRGLSIAVNDEGLIVAMGADEEVVQKFPENSFEKVLELAGKSVVPGLVDGHTHPVWAGDRVHEFAMKLGGASYMEVHRAGGGIHFTVNHTRKAPHDELLALLVKRLNRMSKTGTTLVECKSGYGLDTATELKMLEVLEAAKYLVPLDISSTYCGAHAVPKGDSAETYTQKLLKEQIPALKTALDNKKINVDSIDVFCEDGVFSVDQTRRILEAGRSLSLMLNFHAEELKYLGGVEMGASMKAEAMSHLEEISDDGIEAMAASGSVAVLLPTTAHILRLTPPPARKMIDAGVPVALGSDFNPNAYCTSMPFVMSLACIQMHMTLEEALTAATLNAAHSVRKSHLTGSIEEGKQADLVVINASRWEHLLYQLSGSDDLISYVIHKGDVVHEKTHSQENSITRNRY